VLLVLRLKLRSSFCGGEPSILHAFLERRQIERGILCFVKYTWQRHLLPLRCTTTTIARHLQARLELATNFGLSHESLGHECLKSSLAFR